MFGIQDALENQSVVFNVFDFQVLMYIESYLEIAKKGKERFGNNYEKMLENDLYGALNNFFVKNKEYQPNGVAVEIVSPFANNVSFVANFELVKFHEMGRTKQLKASISLK